MKTILHLVNTVQSVSQFSNKTFGLISDTDAILFIENGVYNAVSTTDNQDLLGEIRAQIYVLMPDLEARGLNEKGILDYVSSVDYDGFVDLTAQFDVSMSW